MESVVTLPYVTPAQSTSSITKFFHILGGGRGLKSFKNGAIYSKTQTSGLIMYVATVTVKPQIHVAKSGASQGAWGLQLQPCEV